MSSDTKCNLGKNVLVTGGGRGIGRGIVESLAADGWNVVLCGRSDPSRYADFVESIRQKYLTSVTFLSHDISDVEGHDAFLREVYRHVGRLDALVNNAGVAPLERRDLLKKTGCIVCNQQEAGILFSEDYDELGPEQLQEVISRRIEQAQIPQMVVTMGSQGAVYAKQGEGSGFCPPQKVDVADTTGAGDAFFAGVTIGLTYGKTLEQACVIGTRLASSVITTMENVCPRFLPEEFDLEVPGE